MISPGNGLQVVVSHPRWALGTEPSSGGKAANTLNCEPSLQALGNNFLDLIPKVHSGKGGRGDKSNFF